MSTAQEIQFATQEKNGWTIWKVSGRLDRTTGNLATEEGEKVLATTQKLAMNLSGLDYISSAGIRVLMRIAKKAAAAEKTFVLCGAKGMVKNVFEEASLSVLMTIYNSEDDLV